MRLIALIPALCALLWGCASVQTEAEEVPAAGETVQVTPAPEPVPPAEDEAQDLTPALTPEDFVGKLGLARFEIEPGEESLAVSAELMNLLANETLSLEVAARFLDSEGETLSQSPWTQAVIGPRNRYLFYARTDDFRAQDAKLRVRYADQAGAE